VISGEGGVDKEKKGHEGAGGQEIGEKLPMRKRDGGYRGAPGEQANSNKLL